MAAFLLPIYLIEYESCKCKAGSESTVAADGRPVCKQKQCPGGEVYNINGPVWVVFCPGPTIHVSDFMFKELIGGFGPGDHGKIIS